MRIISNLFIPLLVLIIIIYGAKKKINVYDTFVEELSKLLPVKSGEFGGKMVLSIIADGPSTVVLDN